ncbi:MAG: ABC transporter substrate-binding protein [Deltaproteobacteria bacterium]|nr:ABC transporter substrate-binding protein [Deltaproteobacteria bacterium]
MRQKFFKPGILFLAITFAMTSSLWAGAPTDQLKTTIDKVIGILSDSDLKAPEKSDEKKQKVRGAVDEIFDWAAFSQRAMAKYWKERTPEEKKEFIDLFGRLLERTYLDKVENYSGETVKYVGEKIDGKYAIVNTIVLSKSNAEIDVNYRLRDKDGKWMVYDVYIEGVSMVNNYRIQFTDILMKSSYQELVKRLEEKIAEEPSE